VAASDANGSSLAGAVSKNSQASAGNKKYIWYDVIFHFPGEIDGARNNTLKNLQHRMEKHLWLVPRLIQPEEVAMEVFRVSIKLNKCNFGIAIHDLWILFEPTEFMHFIGRQE